MAVYVDPLHNGWCHLATDGGLDELHQFAKGIGLKRAWFQDHPKVPHYDLVASKRKLAVSGGALIVGAKELFRRCDVTRTYSEDGGNET